MASSSFPTRHSPRSATPPICTCSRPTCARPSRRSLPTAGREPPTRSSTHRSPTPDAWSCRMERGWASRSMKRGWRAAASSSRVDQPKAELHAPREENVMQIGFNAPTTGPLIEPDSLVRIVTEGELLGFDYVTISDHIMVPRNLQSKYPYTGTGEFPAGASAAWLEQLTTTAFVAGLTKKLRFVLSVMV